MDGRDAPSTVKLITRDGTKGSAQRANKKPGTGDPLHTKEPVTVASFRTWRGWRENVARNRCLTLHLNKRSPETGMETPAFDYDRLTLWPNPNAPLSKSLKIAKPALTRRGLRFCTAMRTNRS